MSWTLIPSCALQASLREHTVIESKPENTLEDLRCSSKLLADRAKFYICIYLCAWVLCYAVEDVHAGCINHGQS